MSQVAPELLDRREFLRLVEAAIASAGLAGCTLQPPEHSRPYVVSPETILPGTPTYYATSVPFAGYGIGVIGKCTFGRPIKLEGHPDHPASLGSSDVFTQAQILSLYDPDRSKIVLQGGNTQTWETLTSTLSAKLKDLIPTRGRSMRILAGTTTSPVVTAQLEEIFTAFPEARLARFEPVGDDFSSLGLSQVFGQALHPVPNVARAKRLLLFDCDLFYSVPGSIRHARDFADQRAKTTSKDMIRTYAIEPTPSISGANADHRLPLCGTHIPEYVRALARMINGVSEKPTHLVPPHQRWLEALANDLIAHAGESLILAGRSLPPEVHALVHYLNLKLGAVGKTITYTESFDATLQPTAQSLAELTSDMSAGKVDFLLMLGVNPVYAGSADGHFARALSKVELSIHHGPYVDETAQACTWHAPEVHALESWGDIRAYDGTVSLMQPLVRPLVDGRTKAELLSLIVGSAQDGLSLLRKRWNPASEGEWLKLVERGIVEQSAAEAQQVQVKQDVVAQLLAPSVALPFRQNMELDMRPDPCVWDGCYSNNGWLQETPKPYLTLTWENAVLLSPTDAARLGVEAGQRLELTVEDRKITAPALPMPGQAEGVATITFGYGRAAGGKLAALRGFNAYLLRTSDHLWNQVGLQIIPLKGSDRLALTQGHHTMEGRDPAKAVTLNALLANAAKAHQELNADEPVPSDTLYPPMPIGEYSWGMSIDLNRCIGCNACTIACQAENNIPTVGKEQVIAGREMHWIRVDRYFDGDQLNPDIRFQPVPCMHCEKAPCEVVCPVGATVHDKEGLNEMVYNRCVGTRYCSNNCPYKVRRFNFFAYANHQAPVSNLHYNPDVSVRERGVMEKCTYCIQRINGARTTAEKENRRIRDGEVTPACAAACPTEAIVFGDIADKKSRVAREKGDPRNYHLLADLNTRPRTSYLARVKNPNPEIAGTPS